MLNVLKKHVEEILREQPETRNSDIALTIAIWKKYFGIEDKIHVNQLYDLPREDNVKRIRAKFTEEFKKNTFSKKYHWAVPTDWKVAKQRGLNELEWKEALGYATQRTHIKDARKQSAIDKEEFNKRNPKLL